MTRLAPDPSGCEREPIHIPGSIQPAGHLLVLEARSLKLLQASAEAASLLGGPIEKALGTVPGLLDPTLRDVLASDMLGPSPAQVGIIQPVSGPAYQAIAHRQAGGPVILELEILPTGAGDTLEALYPLLSRSLEELRAAATLNDLMARAAAVVRALTGFDRVLIYRFDPDWNGTVVAEDRNETLPSYLGLRFPASDIPAQARALYTINRLRLISDASYRPVPLVPPLLPGSRKPLDMSFSVLRSVSPVHVEYMRNMGTAASMSVSLIHDGRLWGLVSCHHATPRRPSFAVRTACDLVGQVVAIQSAAIEARTEAADRLDRAGIQGRLLAGMTSAGGFVEGLASNRADLLGLIDAEGAAILFGETCTLVGRTPGEDAVRRIANWLGTDKGHDSLAAASLPLLMPEAAAWKDTAAGLMAVPISELHSSYVMWFRPERLQQIAWAGEPVKVAAGGETGISPRKSFATWRESVQLHAVPWSAAQVQAAQDLRNTIVGIVLRQAEERAQLTQELERSNKELAAFAYSVSHDLRAPFRHIVGYSELLKELSQDRLSEEGLRYIEVIIESAQSAGLLVDSLLNFSRMGRAALTPLAIGMGALVKEAIRSLGPDLKGRHIEWRLGELPEVTGDPVMLRQAVQNLLSNAVKYTRDRDPAIIEITAEAGRAETIFSVRDNGVGFDMAYASKLFGVFQRLHRMEEFEGIGIGLANVRRIIDRHSGRTWAEGTPNQGATFYFSLPNRKTAEGHG